MGVMWHSLPMSNTNTTKGATVATFTTQGQEGAIRMTSGSYFVDYGTQEAQECSNMGLAVRRMLVIIGTFPAKVRDSRGQAITTNDMIAMRADNEGQFGPLS